MRILLILICLYISPRLISAQCNLQTFVNANSATCNGSADGLASVVAQGGSSYTYQWSTGSTNNIVPNLSAGVYYVTVTSDTCVAIDSATVIEPLAIELSVVVDSNVICGGTATGSATATVTNGVGTITYNWESNDNTASASMLEAGPQLLTVFDINGCTATDSFSLTEPPIIVANESILNEDIAGNCNGEISINPSGGTGNLSFFWFNGDSSNTTLTDLCAGSYTIVIIDSIGCSEAFNFTVATDASVNLNYNPFPKLSYYPNPVVNQLYITDIETKTRYTVFNSVGQTIEQGITNSPELLINTKYWSQGIYYINLERAEGKTYSFKVSK